MAADVSRVPLEEFGLPKHVVVDDWSTCRLESPAEKGSLLVGEDIRSSREMEASSSASESSN